MQASVQRVNGDFVGVLRGAPADAPMLLGFGARPLGHELVFADMREFARAVAELAAAGLVQDAPPYLAFSVREPGAAFLPFDWGRFSAEAQRLALPHQRAAVERCVHAHNGRSYVALPPGTGKTLIGCVLAAHYGPDALVVCPATVVRNWQREYVRWTGLAAPCAEVKDGPVSPGATVVSFETLKARPHLLAHAWAVVVVDECHKLKHDSQRTLAMMPMLARARAVVMMSGTPQDGKTAHLFNQLRALHPAVFADREVFTDRFSLGHTDRWGRRVERGAQRLHELSLLLQSCAFLQEEVALAKPAFRRVMHEMEPGEAQRRELAAMAAARAQLRAAPDSKGKQLRVDAQTMAMWRRSGQIKAKMLEPMLELLVREEHADEKVVFFVHHLDVAEEVERCASRWGETVRITGCTAAARRDELIERFRQVDAGPRFAVVTMGAAGVGCNFSPGVSVAVFVELSHQQSEMRQSEDRCNRMGAARAVTSHWLTLRASCDAEMVGSLQSARQVHDTVVHGKRQRFEFGD